VVEQLDALYAKGDADDFDAIQALKKKCGRVRPDMLHLAVSHLKDKHNIISVGAPYEAEAQCREMEQTLADVGGVLSVDSDTIPLGCEKVVNKMYWGANGDGERTVVCSVLRKQEVLHRTETWIREELSIPDFNLNDDGLYALCNFLGNDYILRVLNNGKKRCAVLCQEYNDGGDDVRMKILEDQNFADVEGRNKKTWGKKGGRVADYQHKFTIATNFFKYSPVWRRISGKLHIVPLNPLPHGSSWQDLIGFDPVSTYDMCGVPADKAISMEESCRYGMGTMVPVPLPADPDRP
jgi:hypothetical protein